jgi:hypothetical protein
MMKQVYTIALAVAWACWYSIATAQTFQPATVLENVYPTGLPTLASHTSAHSLEVFGVPLYVHIWDDTDNRPVSNGGIAVGYAGNNDMVSLNNVASLEAVAVQEFSGGALGGVYIVATYYDIINQEFMIDMYQYNFPGLVQVAGYPQNIAPFLGAGLSFDYIRIDALDRNYFGVVWTANDNLYTVAGDINTATISNALEIVPNLNFPNGYTEADITLTKGFIFATMPWTGIPYYEAYFVALDQNRQIVGGFSIPFDDILTAPVQPTPYSLSSTVYELNTMGSFSLPRIDALDEVPDTRFVWSYVVHERVFDPLLPIPCDRELIRTFVADYLNGFPTTDFVLNDAFTIGLPTVDISPTVNQMTGLPQVNAKPVVSFETINYLVYPTDIEHIGIYYGWYHKNGMALPNLSAFNNDAYIGMKVTTTRDMLWASNTDYFTIPFLPDNISSSPSLAFSSTNSPNLNELYMAFTQDDPFNGSNIGHKAIPWVNASFGPVGKEHYVGSITAYPNPFHDRIVLQLDEDRGEEYSLILTDILGRTVQQMQGTIVALNVMLQELTLQGGSTQYLLQLTNMNSGATHHIPLIRLAE